MQPPAGMFIRQPGLPSGKEIQAEAKSGFEDDKAVFVTPSLR